MQAGIITLNYAFIPLHHKVYDSLWGVMGGYGGWLWGISSLANSLHRLSARHLLKYQISVETLEVDLTFIVLSTSDF